MENKATKSVLLEDLWPGDVIIARRPGGLTGMPHRCLSLEERDGHVFVRLESLSSPLEFEVLTPSGWRTEVEQVVGASHE